VNLVFDFAGVLFQWQPHELVTRLLPQRAPTEAAAHALVAGFFEGYDGDWGEFDRGTLAADALAARIERRIGVTAADARAVIDAVPHALQPDAGTVALLRRLYARGHALFFLSNMPAPYADRLDATHDFIGLFRLGVYSGRAGLTKPDAAIFAHAEAVFGIEPRDTLFIDDVMRNVEAARRAGWQAVQFIDPAQCEAELARRALL
jgi:putative hydrolase of the HAD superfamily